MARLHLSAGETKQIKSANSAYVSVSGWLVDTDGANDATLEVKDLNSRDKASVTPQGGFTVTGTDDHGGVTGLGLEAGRCMAPAEATLSGSGATAVVFYSEAI